MIYKDMSRNIAKLMSVDYEIYVSMPLVDLFSV